VLNFDLYQRNNDLLRFQNLRLFTDVCYDYVQLKERDLAYRALASTLTSLWHIVKITKHISNSPQSSLVLFSPFLGLWSSPRFKVHKGFDASGDR
jgi:hypothetical protein